MLTKNLWGSKSERVDMARSPADVVSSLLDAASLGHVSVDSTPWRIFTGREGSAPNAVITLYDTGGESRNPAWRLNYPSIQVRVRGNVDDYRGGWAKANDIVEYLLGITPQDCDGFRLDGIIMQGDITPIGYDSESRPLFTVNFKCFTEPTADSSGTMHRESL